MTIPDIDFIPLDPSFRAYQLQKLKAARQLISGKPQQQVNVEKEQQARDLADLQRRIALSCKLTEKRAAA
jgi:hypothetical protein